MIVNEQPQKQGLVQGEDKAMKHVCESEPVSDHPYPSPSQEEYN